jgi:peptidylprolyl isomerase
VSLLRQVVVNYVAMTPEGRIFENSLEKTPYDIRVGSGQVLPGLDEGLLSMKVRLLQQHLGSGHLLWL